MRNFTFGVVLLIGALLVPLAARAQQTTGAIAGVARDSTGAVLPGVTIEVTSPALIEKVRVANSDAQGNYRIIALPPGTYAVTFTLPGFTTYKREGIDLSSGVTAAVNGDMKVGGMEESVTVSGASPVVDVQNVRGQTVLRAEVLDALPTARTNAGFAELTLGAESRTAGAAVVDQGGSKGDSTQRLTVHGMRGNDQRMFYDGMYQNNLNVGGSGKNWQTNQVGVQEVAVGTSTASSEVETSGMTINYIPKDGGNKFALYGITAGTRGAMQKDNLDDGLRAKGLTVSQRVKSIYDFGLGIGGPIVKDRMWFYSASRKWGAQEYQPGAFYNKTTNPLFYVADRDRPGYQDTKAWDQGVRLSFQLTQKQKLTASYNIQSSCQCFLSLNSTTAPEAAPQVHFRPAQQPIVTWNYAVSNRLLVEAGVSYGHFVHYIDTEELFPGAILIRESSTGLLYGSGVSTGATAAGRTRQPNVNERLSISYLAGSHTFKVGQQWLEGAFNRTLAGDRPNVSYTFNNGRPTSLTQYAVPAAWQDRIRSLGLYAQDQWTLNRVTLNVGVRYDRFLGWVAAGSQQATAFTPTFNYDRVDNVPNFQDVSPRVGAAWDLFGNGKTAVKGSLGRYMGSLGIDYAEANNPSQSIVVSTSRTWNDANGNFVPDCNLTVFTSNGECAAVANNLFGRTSRNTFYDPSVLVGWNTRTYSWQAALAVQQELAPGVAVNVGYYRTSYVNFTVTDNTLVAPADYTTYCVTAPVDPRLPGGGGNQLCGLADLNPTKFGQVSNLVTDAGAFGKQIERYNGVDVQLTARFAGKGSLTGGVSVGRQVTDNCFAVDSPAATREGFCHVSPPWSAGTQYKVNGYYPLFWGIEPSFSIQNLSGAPITATRTFTNAEIQPSLGRRLSACPATGTCNATASVSMIPASTVFLDRVTTVNIGLARAFKVGGGRVKGILDIYNLFNSNTVLNVNGTYGSAWLTPQSIVGGRLFKFSGQFTY